MIADVGEDKEERECVKWWCVGGLKFVPLAISLMCALRDE
jgi:hypothetical protein